VFFDGGPVGSFNIFDDASMSRVSDQIIWDVGPAGATATFWSDLDSGAGLTPFITARPPLIETGSIQPIGGINWHLANGSTITDTLQFVSDAGETPAVPEPASLLLVGTGLLGVVRARRNRRSQ
jgi:hypothetical protein